MRDTLKANTPTNEIQKALASDAIFFAWRISFFFQPYNSYIEAVDPFSKRCDLEN